jgi:ketosteroid isomerase-like protein
MSNTIEPANSIAVNNALADFFRCVDHGDADSFCKLFSKDFSLTIEKTGQKITGMMDDFCSF